MKLASIITGTQQVTLLHESDTAISLALFDPATGESQRVDIKADMVAQPDEALLYVEVQGLSVDVVSDKDKQVDLAEWWARDDVAAEVQQHIIITPETCPCDKSQDYPTCNVCDSGLAICSVCQKGEVELDSLCLPAPTTELEPPPTWTITPDGQEIDLRAREGGLF
jgi:hypothetical protein